MSINPDNITTVRVDQLAQFPVGLTSEFPHAVGTVLKKDTIQALVDLVVSAVGTSSGVGFYPLSVTDGQQLPPVPESPSFFLCGAGTYLNVNGYPDVICTGDLNAVMSVSDHWEVAVQIPITVDLLGIGISQTITSGVIDKAPSENAIYNALAGLTLNVITSNGNISESSLIVENGDYSAEYGEQQLVITNNDNGKAVYLSPNNGLTLNTTGSGQGSVLTDNLTDVREYQLPDASGTILSTAGTQTTAPITGDLQVIDGVSIKCNNADLSGFNNIVLSESNCSIGSDNGVNTSIISIDTESIQVNGNSSSFKGLIGFNDFSDNYTDLTYVQKIYVDNNFQAKQKQYKFLLSQSGGDDPQTQSSGAVTKGVTYFIDGTGGDFSNVGSPTSADGTYFIATATATPNSYGSASLNYNTGTAVITMDVTPNNLGKTFYLQGTGNSTTIFPIGGDFPSLPIVELGAFNFDTGLDLSFISLAGLSVAGIGIVTTDYTGAPSNGALLNTLVTITLTQ